MTNETIPNQLISALCRALIACVLSTTYAQAHDPGLSVANLRLKNSALAVDLQFASADIGGLVPLDKNHDGRISSEELRSALPELQLLGDGSVEASCDGARLVQLETEFRTGPSGEVLFEMNFALPQCTQLSLQSMILKRLPAGHRQYLSLRDQRGNVLAERILDRSSNSFEADLTQSNTAAAAPHVFGWFLILGIQHNFYRLRSPALSDRFACHGLERSRFGKGNHVVYSRAFADIGSFGNRQHSIVASFRGAPHRGVDHLRGCGEHHAAGAPGPRASYVRFWPHTRVGICRRAARVRHWLAHTGRGAPAGFL